MRRRIVAFAILALYLSAVVAVGLYPQRIDAGLKRQVVETIAWLTNHGFVYANYGLLDAVANVIWFVPIGLLMSLAFGHRLWFLSLLAAFTLSASIEYVQATMLPARVGTVSDVVANTIGATFGILIAIAITQALQIRRMNRSMDKESLPGSATAPADDLPNAGALPAESHPVPA